MELRLLTVRQPYASCILRRCKMVENRTRSTPYRGLVAILSATKIFTDDRAQEAANRCFGDSRYVEDRHDFPRGGIIGVAELYGVVTEHNSWWFSGPFGFLLRNPRGIPFIACDGHQQALVESSHAIRARVLQHL